MRTEREKLELAAKGAGIPIEFGGATTAFTPSYHCPNSVPWDPRRYTDQAVELMIAIKGHALGGDTVQEWRERVFEAAVYEGSLMNE